jgi:hypothetical protein
MIRCRNRMIGSSTANMSARDDIPRIFDDITRRVLYTKINIELCTPELIGSVHYLCNTLWKLDAEGKFSIASGSAVNWSLSHSIYSFSLSLAFSYAFRNNARANDERIPFWMKGFSLNVACNLWGEELNFRILVLIAMTYCNLVCGYQQFERTCGLHLHHFNPEDWGRQFFRNIDNYLWNYTDKIRIFTALVIQNLKLNFLSNWATWACDYSHPHSLFLLGPS